MLISIHINLPPPGDNPLNTAPPYATEAAGRSTMFFFEKNVNNIVHYI